MKKILLGLFILGTLGMAQGNYKINVKNGVKFSQSEIDQESKEIENIVNRDLFEKVNDAFQKKILVKVREFNKQYMDNLINESMKEVPQNQRQSFKEFMRNISNIINNTLITKDIFETDIKSISFSGENDAKVNKVNRKWQLELKNANINEVFDNLGEVFDVVNYKNFKGMRFK